MLLSILGHLKPRGSHRDRPPSILKPGTSERNTPGRNTGPVLAGRTHSPEAQAPSRHGLLTSNSPLRMRTHQVGHAPTSGGQVAQGQAPRDPATVSLTAGSKTEHQVLMPPGDGARTATSTSTLTIEERPGQGQRGVVRVPQALRGQWAGSCPRHCILRLPLGHTSTLQVTHDCQAGGPGPGTPSCPGGRQAGRGHRRGACPSLQGGGSCPPQSCRCLLGPQGIARQWKAGGHTEKAQTGGMWKGAEAQASGEAGRA